MLYPINLTPEQISYIGIVLGKCPYGEVRDLVNSIQAQIADLEKPKEAPVDQE